MKIYPFKGSYPKVELITSPGSFFSSIKAQDMQEDALFVLQVKSANGTHTGLLSLTDVKEMAQSNYKERHW